MSTWLRTGSLRWHGHGGCGVCAARLLLWICVLVLTTVQAGAAPFRTASCPPALGGVADCQAARDSKGAIVLVAMPQAWNRRLLVHAHGGPRLGEPQLSDAQEDLARHAVLVRAGYAWVGSTYRRGGYGVRMAAADVERSRRLFLRHFPRPQRILLHGQSWGGNVAAKLAELHALDARGRARYDAVLTTNGVLTGGTRAYGFRADLRVVWQHYCHNHPAPDEPQYPLWQGLPRASTMTRAELMQRIEQCTGWSLAPTARSARQAAALHAILAVTGIAEPQLPSHLAWATFHFRDLVHKRLGGRNPFDNRKTRYQGSADDAALNAAVERFSADPAALAQLAYDADLSGLIVLPTLNVHASNDPVVSPRALSVYAATVRHAGRAHLLAQVKSDESEHSRLADATYLTALLAIESWLDTGVRPEAAALQRTCIDRSAEPETCRFLTP